MKIINIGKDFSIYPAGRYYDDGDYSGQKFRDEILIPALISNDVITIELDDTRGYDSSFLEEAFGGVFRQNGNVDLKNVIDKIELSTEDHFLAEEIKSYMEDAYKSKR